MKKTVVLTGDIITNGEPFRENGKVVYIEDGLFTSLHELDGYQPPAGTDVVGLEGLCRHSGARGLP